jgi:methylglutaconyl-CoA hydratase
MTTREDSVPSVDGLTVEKSGSVMVARLNRPGGNLMTLAMCDELARILLHPPEGSHLLVLEAAGESFCLGRERAAVSPDELPGEVRRLIAVNQALLHTPLVTLARVHGDAAGFGVGLAALCDVAVAVDSATFSFPEVRMDLAPTLVLAWLARVVGRRNAFWLTATGEEVHGSAAVEMSLVNEVVEDEAALDAALERRVAALQAHAPRVHADIRAMLRSAAGMSEEQAYELSADRLVVGSLLRRRT